MAEKPGAIIAIDKPVQWTSFQVVGKLKWHLKRTFGLTKFKIGHAGTLDPLASGLLLVCVGSATKRIDELQTGEKVYSGTMVLGATTPCYDLEQAIDAYYPTEGINAESLDKARRHLIGTIEQVPPQFSAVKVDGQRAYRSARDGEEVQIAPKKVTINEFTITAFRPGDNKRTYETSCAADDKGTLQRNLYRAPQGSVPDGLPQIDFSITCGKGTYIRSIARDFGQEMGSGAFLCALRRERIGNYSVSDALTMDDIERIITPDNPSYSCLLGLK